MTNKDSSNIFDGFEGNLGELIPILQKVQEKLGYISEEAVEQVSRFLKISPNQIFGVASFYKQFKFVESGKYTIKVCMGTACHVRGAVSILDEFQRKLGIGPDETTADKLFTLETVNCLGACALGPIVVFGEDYHGQMKMKAVEELIEKARSENKEEAGALS
jgi:NADH:ubiquinone oxidoreductase subunit E